MRYKFCPLCGKELVERYSFDEGGVPYCQEDDIMFFDTPKPCIMVAIRKEDEILLLKQSYIYKDSKVLLSGYVGIDETAEETVYREVREEAGLEICDVRYLGTDFVKDKEILMIIYIAKYVSGSIKKSNEVEEIGWVKLNKAIEEMKEDTIGKKVVQKVLDTLNTK